MEEAVVKSNEELSCELTEESPDLGSEQLEENYIKSKQLSDDTLELENSKSSPNGSEYESVDSAGSSSENEEAEGNMRSRPQHSKDDVDDECGLESEGSVILEREEGDGQESIPLKKIDDDEDKKNPQYIPKRGTFYEHDDRTLDEPEKQELAEKSEKQSKKNVWMEKKERWSHDRYNDNEQAPKSRSELVAIYGYDIRNEDGPPRARRRRRYGRGPNKYTRTWEDVDAYKPAKPVKTNPKKPIKNRDEEEYPPLTNKNNRQSDENIRDVDNFEDEESEDSSQNQHVNRSISLNNATSSNDISKSKQEVPIKKFNNSVSEQSNNKSLRIGTGRIMKPKPDIKKEIKDSDYRGFTKTRQFRNSKAEQKILPKPPRKEKKDINQTQNNKQTNVQDIEKDLNKMNIQDGIAKTINKSNSQRQASVPPRLQGEQKGSKRYSSLRQRSLPETATPPFTQANYYTNEYNQQAQAPQQQPLLPQPNAIHATTPQVPQIAPPPLPPIPQQVPVTATPILQAPPQFASPFPQAPTAFLQPTVPPPPFLSQQPPPIINYVQGQQFPQPPPFQGYQHQQFNAVTPQPAELYQCQGGTTYYSTQNQHPSQRTAPQKRPKAAIPIVPPPPQEPRGRGRTNNPRESPPMGEENSEHIVINHDMNDSNTNFEDAVIQQ